MHVLDLDLNAVIPVCHLTVLSQGFCWDVAECCVYFVMSRTYGIL